MSTHTITFEEIELPNGHVATGSFVAVYHVERAQPDCGIPRHVEIDDYHDVEIMVDVVDEDGNVLSSYDDAGLLADIIKALGEDRICEEIYHAI